MIEGKQIPDLLHKSFCFYLHEGNYVVTKVNEDKYNGIIVSLFFYFIVGVVYL